MLAHDHDAASIATNTVDTVAGSSVAITEAEEDASSLAVGGTATSNADDDDAAADDVVNKTHKKMLMTRTSSCSLDISLANDDDNNNDAVTAAAIVAANKLMKEEEEEGAQEEEESYTAPMHLHALRAPAKLLGAPRSRSSSRSRPGSRRNSSSPPRNLSGNALSELVMVGGTTAAGSLGLNNSTISPSISVGSSLDGIANNNSNNNDHHHHHRHHSSHGDGSVLIDRDILLDKLGFQDLDPEISQGEVHDMLRKHNSLPTLNERMSEETMDDVHAFQNLTFCKRPSTGSSCGSIATLEEASSEVVLGGEDASSSPERAASREGLTTTMMTGNKSLSSPAALQLNTLDEEEEGEEEEEEEEGVDDDDDDNDDVGNGKEENHDILDIPKGVIHLREKPILNGKFTSSIATLGVLSSTACGDDDEDNDEDDDEEAEVEVPTSIMQELDINEGKRKLLHRDTSLMVVGGSDMDFLEDDEQDGLEADLANVGEEQR